MADPLSIFSGALTLADTTLRVGKFVKEVYKCTKHIDEELESLKREIETFRNTYTALEALCTTGVENQEPQSQLGPDSPCIALWTRAAALVQEGFGVIRKLEVTLESILGGRSSLKVQKIEDVRRAIKLSSKSNEYNELRGRLTNLNLELNTMLTGIELTSSALMRSKMIASLEDLPGKLTQNVQELEMKLKQQIVALEKISVDLPQSIVSAKAAASFASLNEHFYVQNPDTSIWTGRKKHLDTLRDTMLNPQTEDERVQKRFVVHGISGAGKTQFCCKFAQDYRESFWGIFWVDATSEQTARESWKRIAKIGGKDLNDEAGKHWLSNLQSPWLLIIDSADSSKDSITSQFPSGDRGCILITTRNPRLRINATVGSLTLDKLEEDEAIELLRKATNQNPWDESASSAASAIAQHLGYLPLALIHAGRAISHQLCTLHDYIPFLNKAFDNYQKTKHAYLPKDDDENGMGAFKTFNLTYLGLEMQACAETSLAVAAKDAIELINTFAFMHNSDININMFIKAGRNLRQTAGVKKKGKENHDTPASVSFLERLGSFGTEILIKFMRPVPTLPRILRAVDDQSFDETRTRKALSLLVEVALLSESSEPGIYSMHRLVHIWARKRLSSSAQALWCGMAGDTLASSIKLPPTTDETGDQDLYVRLLPHINQVRTNKKDIGYQLLQNCQGASYIRSWVWFNKPSSFTTMDALNSAKYSRVYMECFKFSEAEVLQRGVRDFVLKWLGQDNQFVVPISMALAKTLWLLARAAEAQELQEDVLRICRSKLGEKDPQTLMAMDALGETYWQRGWLKEAKALHQSAIDGMEGNPDLKRERLKAMTHLGHVHEWYTEFAEAQRLHEKASEELTRAYGDDDFDTLVAKDSLAMTLLQIGEVAQTKRAHDLMRDIYKRRRKTLGEEHLYTLWAACNLARTLTTRGSLENNSKLIEEAKLIFQDGLAITHRNLGPNHVGTLMGRMFLAEAHVAEKKYDVAEEEYKDIAERQKTLPGSRAGTHRDRLVTLERLADCYEIQGRFQEALRVCTTIVQELDGMGGQKHPWRVKVTERQMMLLARVGASLI